jgi:DNA helicase HerA-like ATPase
MFNPIELGQRVIGGEKTDQKVSLLPTDRSTHTYITGASGEGKSYLLEGMLRQQLLAWRSFKIGMLVIDPHGSMINGLVAWMTRYKNTHLPVVVVDLAKPDSVVGLSPLRAMAGEDRSSVASRFVDALGYVWGEGSGDSLPQFDQWAFNVSSALLASGLTPVDAEILLESRPTDLKRAILSRLGDSSVASDFAELTPATHRTQLGSTIRRWKPLLQSSILRLSLGQDRNLDWSRALEEGWIVLVSTARSGDAGKTLTTLLLADLWHAASSREKRKGIKPFVVCIDEFQNFITPTIAQNLAEARGFGLSLVLAHQFPNQVKDSGTHGRRLFNEVMNNAQTKITFKLGAGDSRILADQMMIEPGWIQSLEKRNCLVKTPSQGRLVQQTFTMDVFDSYPTEESKRAWIADQMNRWRDQSNGGFVFTAEEAAASIERRRESLRRVADIPDPTIEPKTAKRKIDRGKAD